MGDLPVCLENKKTLPLWLWLESSTSPCKFIAEARGKQAWQRNTYNYTDCGAKQKTAQHNATCGKMLLAYRVSRHYFLYCRFYTNPTGGHLFSTWPPMSSGRHYGSQGARWGSASSSLTCLVKWAGIPQTLRWRLGAKRHRCTFCDVCRRNEIWYVTTFFFWIIDFGFCRRFAIKAYLISPICCICICFEFSTQPHRKKKKSY